MPTFGNISSIIASSGSIPTSSFAILPFFVADPSYGLGSTSSIAASINATIITQSSQGVASEITINIPSPETLNTAGVPILRLSSTGSNNEPRVGIGFDGNERPIKAFDIKSKTDSSIGTEILIRSSRTTTGAQVGDEAGVINFVIDTGSFIDITTTGSIARIKTKVDEISSSGVGGRLQFGLTRNIDTEIDIMEMSYGDSTFADFYATTTPRTFEIKDISSHTTPSQNASFIHSNGNNPYTIIRTDNPGTSNQGGLIQVNNKFGTGSIHLHGPTGEITASSFVGDGFEFEGQILKSTARSSAYGNNTYEGQIIKFGADILTANKAYIFTSIGWNGVDANSVSTTKGLFGIALGTDSSVDGLLTRGVHASSNWSGFSAGDTLYIGLSSGVITNSTSSHTTGDSIRVVGYALGSNYIYLDPSPNYETL